MKCVAILWTSEDLRRAKPEGGRRERRKKFLVIQNKEIKVRSKSHWSLHFHSKVRMVRQRSLEKQDQTSRMPPNFKRPRRLMVSECCIVGNKKTRRSHARA
ncbi:hypothetical protein ANCCAN_08301 [Ancylostoma caninum]|uniref:Uncharacterized protein n=1 Tax=Ancylostoma caninum TaxID=29170 RepID=A0A368GMT7_ANCCA|nr:hypothetical protein ANCCAN_08301 [Ancylostoma caninum]